MEARARAAVEEFEAARRELGQFHDDHEDVLRTYAELIHEYNTARTNADQSVRSALDAAPLRQKELIIGGFGVRRSTKVIWDGDLLAGLVSGQLSEQFLTPQFSYKVDADELERLISLKEIEHAAVQEARTEKHTLRAVPGAPKPLSVSFQRD